LVKYGKDYPFALNSGPVGLAGGLVDGGIATAALTIQQWRRKLIEDKYTKLIDTCKEKIEKLRPNCKI
jgi:hypothetical protein